MKIETLILGCGSSAGTPVIGCDCATCTSPYPRNKRTRTSALISANGVNFLIDTGPDLRTQALRENIRAVDAVLYTHPHADHLNGIDDLRAFCYLKKGAIPLFGSAYTMQNIIERFDYAVRAPNGESWELPSLQPTTVSGEFCFGGVTVIPIPVLHGQWPILGYRIGNTAWITDTTAFPSGSLDLLADLDVLFLDCLRERPHHTHFSVDQAIAAATQIGARHTVFIHMTHDLEYHTLSAKLPAGMSVGYDGLRHINN